MSLSKDLLLASMGVRGGDHTGEQFEEAHEEARKGGVVDWNQNDPTAPDYVKNRPFYEEVSENVLYSADLSLEYVSDSGLYSIPDGVNTATVTDFVYSPTVLDAGTAVTVTYNGVDYECYVLSGGGAYGNYIGNLTIHRNYGEEDTGEPFCFVFGAVNVLHSKDTSCTVKVTQTVSNITPLPSKFIPALRYELAIEGNDTDGWTICEGYSITDARAAWGQGIPVYIYNRTSGRLFPASNLGNNFFYAADIYMSSSTTMEANFYQIDSAGNITHYSGNFTATS